MQFEANWEDIGSPDFFPAQIHSAIRRDNQEDARSY